jgi:ABC-2 type transport system permease protein
MSFFTEFKKEWLEQRRTKKFLVALIVLVLFGMTSPLLAKLTPQILTMVPGGESLIALIPTPTVADAVGQYLKNTGQFGILLALLFSMGAVAAEKEKGTSALVLSKPMPRFVFLMAKFCALALTFTCALVLSGLLGYYYTVVLFGSVPMLPWLEMNGLLLLYLLIYAAITLFFSTLTRTQYIAAGGAFGVLILLSIVGSLPGLGKYVPAGLLENASNLMSGAGIAGWQCLWIGIGLIVIFLMSAWLVFRRQEL